MFKVMKASKATDSDFRFPLIASPKVDGFRGYVRGAKLNARSNKAVPNRATAVFFSHPALDNMDGELIVGQPNATDAFQVTTSALRSMGGDPKAMFLVFDFIDDSLGFTDRLAKLDAAVAALPAQFKDRVIALAQVRCESLADLLQFEATCLEQGFEGVMVRNPNGRYKQGRSTVGEHGLLKLKRFSDAEAVVIGKQEEVGINTKHGKGTLGALVCRDLTTGVEFNIGTGFTAKQRKDLWLAKLDGEIVKYKYFAIGMVNAPRFPAFIGLRAAVDM
jgi:DNA ligase-1